MSLGANKIETLVDKTIGVLLPFKNVYASDRTNKCLHSVGMLAKIAAIMDINVLVLAVLGDSDDWTDLFVADALLAIQQQEGSDPINPDKKRIQCAAMKREIKHSSSVAAIEDAWVIGWQEMLKAKCDYLSIVCADEIVFPGHIATVGDLSMDKGLDAATGQMILDDGFSQSLQPREEIDVTRIAELSQAPPIFGAWFTASAAQKAINMWNKDSSFETCLWLMSGDNAIWTQNLSGIYSIHEDQVSQKDNEVTMQRRKKMVESWEFYKKISN